MSASGLVVTDLTTGSGEGFSKGYSLTCNYVLTIGGFEEQGGSVIDATRTRGKPFTFKYDSGQVIKGWDQGVTGMKVGGKRRLTIPSELGYGAAGAGQMIPPNSTLYFEIELLGASPR